jgi:hypothetical protein
MSNRHCGPDIVKYFVVEPSTGGSITGSTTDFFVCDGVLFTNTISGCTDNVNINGNDFNGDGSVLFNSSITACTAIHTSNLYGCSPITIHDLAIFQKGIDVVTGDTILLATSATTFTLTDLPNLNNTATQILTRNATTGLLEYRDVSSITPDTNTFVTGTTFGSNQAVLTRNDGVEVFKLSGGTNLTLSNPLPNLIRIDLSSPPDTNTFVTGGTYNPSTDTITLTRNDSVQINITGVTDTFTTGGTYDNGTKLITFVKNDGTNYTVNLSTIDTNDTFTTGFTYNDANTFTISRNGGLSDLTTSINNVTGFTINGDLTISGNTNISETPQIDTNPVLQLLTRDSSSGDVKIKPVPNTLNYGLFSQTGDSVTIVNTDVETSIIDGGIGTLSVPINGFQIGDNFETKMYGLLSNGAGQDIRIKLKSGSIILADSLMQNLVAHSDDVFTLEVNFTIRNIGSAGTAEIITIGTFQATKKNSDNVFGFSFVDINNTTFDTTISNTLDITIEWDNASNNNSIKSQVFTLKKVY